jgi:hypothetical protein
MNEFMSPPAIKFYNFSNRFFNSINTEILMVDLNCNCCQIAWSKKKKFNFTYLKYSKFVNRTNKKLIVLKKAQNSYGQFTIA